MFWTKLRLIGATPIDLPKENAIASGPFVFKGADGLGPADINVSISQTLFQKGEYGASVPQNKQIIIRIGLQPDWVAGQTPADLRQTIYGLLSPGRTNAVDIQVMDGATVIAKTVGYPSRCEIVPFSKDPQVQVTFDTDSPYLIAPAKTTVPLAELQEFYDDPDPEFDMWVPFGTITIDYPGTAPTGFFAKFQTQQEYGTGSPYNPATMGITDDEGDELILAITGSDDPGMKFSVNTEIGSRNVKVDYTTVGEVEKNFLQGFSEGSVWLQLYPGENVLEISPGVSAPKWLELSYTAKYWGV